ncbi:MAG TPA: peptidylprolyl isomerase [Ferruginibacter sp.]|nr:peptidylprolyl isomerase [Ferruginibacter sp.]
MKKFIAIVLLVFLMSCKTKYANPHIVIHSNYGDIEIELFAKQAPKTVAAFLAYVDSGFYDNSSFYRVLLTEGLTTDDNIGLIQGGIWQTDPKHLVKIPGIVHESTKQTGLSHTDGTISLARSTPGSANTEFFICIGDQTQLDYGNTMQGGDGQGFAAFGRVVKGMSIVRKIQEQPSNGESFTGKILIYSIEKL